MDSGFSLFWHLATIYCYTVCLIYLYLFGVCKAMDDEEIAELLRAEITDEQAIFSDEFSLTLVQRMIYLYKGTPLRSDNSYSHNIDSSTSPLTPKQDDLSTSLLSDEDLMSAPPKSNADPMLLLPTTNDTDEDPSYSPLQQQVSVDLIKRKLMQTYLRLI
ncbi:hypothetical protein J6590_092609 [Homalodisca vitripennis]|nr:hypothetical protein J6590_092609 [Homalodisca vitripennis]